MVKDDSIYFEGQGGSADGVTDVCVPVGFAGAASSKRESKKCLNTRNSRRRSPICRPRRTMYAARKWRR
ncbi:hypothetical protein EMIT0111MI5_170071 [Burkholderia sp. IT-111MI5]